MVSYAEPANIVALVGTVVVFTVEQAGDDPEFRRRIYAGQIVQINLDYARDLVERRRTVTSGRSPANGR